MAGDSSLCIEGRILPWYGAHVSVERLIFRRPLPHVVRLSRPPSTISQSDCRQIVRSSLPYRLVGPYKLRLNLTALPCSHEVLWSHAGGTNPGSISGHSLCRIQRFRLPHRGIGSATSITIDFGVIFPFTDVPAYDLPVYASQCRTSHHARLGTRLPAKLCRGHHFRQLNFKSFQGATLHRSGQAAFPHPALTSGDNAYGAGAAPIVNAAPAAPRAMC
jgi:hypothetical protein